MRQYEIVGRRAPSDKHAAPDVYKMQIFATNEVLAKSRFFYFLRKLKKVKRSVAEILSVRELAEKKPKNVKNYAIWVRYQSRSGIHNMYKEYRDVTINGAVDQMYMEMSSRHRADKSAIQIMKYATISSKQCRRARIMQFHNPAIAFPVTRTIIRPAEAQHKVVFSSKLPQAYLN